MKSSAFALPVAVLIWLLVLPQTVAGDVATAPSKAEDDQLRSLFDDAQALVRKPGLTGYAADLAAALAEVGEAESSEAVFSLVSLDNRSGDVSLRKLATGYARNGDLARV